MSDPVVPPRPDARQVPAPDGEPAPPVVPPRPDAPHSTAPDGEPAPPVVPPRPDAPHSTAPDGEPDASDLGPGPAAPPRGAVATAAAEARALVSTAGRILLHYGLPLLAVATVGLALRERIAIYLAPTLAGVDAVLGILVFALAPAVAFGTVAAMLLLVGRRADRTASAGGLGVLGSALLIYLLIYEQDGSLRAQRLEYLDQAFSTALWSLDDPGDAGDRIPDSLSVTVLVIVAVAFLLRVGGAWLLDRWKNARESSGQPAGLPARVLAGVLRVLVAYAEIVWIVLAVVSLSAIQDEFGTWWSERAVVHAVSAWWTGLGLPDVTGVVGALATAGGVLVGAVVAGLVVPLVWLALAAIVYGSRFGDVAGVAERAARLTSAAQQRVTSVVRLRRGTGRGTDLARLERSWARLTEPEGRWDALGGAGGLVLALGPVPVLVYCVAFLLVQQVQYPIWWLAELLPLTRRSDWGPVSVLVEACITVVTLTLTVAVVAAAADRALRLAGLGTALQRGLTQGRPPSLGQTLENAQVEVVQPIGVPPAQLSGTGNDQ
ncbi:hypothetical protein [Miniimonas arenae]|uniref:hypothetical protein n=1 Tax=Miniimonas arenae TaxID=676201 RepID=UPI0015D578EB|nr:hypothetical protein [Miniimonas arenae]